MEDGRELSLENMELEPEDDSFSISDVNDLSHSSDEQDGVQRSSVDLVGCSGRSIAEPCTPTFSSTVLSDEDSSSLDDSLAEEDAVLKNNLELMSESEDHVEPHNASHDLQLSSDSSSFPDSSSPFTSDLNATTKSDNEGHHSQHISDEIDRFSSCKSSVETNELISIDSSDATRFKENECDFDQRTKSVETVDYVTLTTNNSGLDSLNLRISPDSKHDEDRDVDNISFEEENQRAGVEELHPVQADFTQGGSQLQDEDNKNSSDSSSVASQPSSSTKDKELCDSEPCSKEAQSMESLLEFVEPVSDQSSHTEVKEDLSKSDIDGVPSSLDALVLSESSFEDGSTVDCGDSDPYPSKNNFDIHSNTHEELINNDGKNELRSPENSNVLTSTEMTLDVSTNKPDESFVEAFEGSMEDMPVNSLKGKGEGHEVQLNKIEDSGKDAPTNIAVEAVGGSEEDSVHEDTSEDDTHGDLDTLGNYRRVNGGFSESMDCDDITLNSEDQCLKPVVTSNALNAAWKKAFANTAKKYESPTTEETKVSCKSPVVAETSNTGSSGTSSVEPLEDEDDGNNVLAGSIHDNEEQIIDNHDSLSNCGSLVNSESLVPLPEVDEPGQQVSQTSQPQSFEAPREQDCNSKINSLMSHLSVVGPGKRLFEPAQSISGMHVNMANPIPEYPQYLGLQPTVKFKCVRCGLKGFTSMMELKTHQLSCLKNTSPAPQGHQLPSSPSASTNIRITRKVYLCSACGTYYENWNLFLHMREVHKRHICLFCLGMFSQAEKLSLHLVSKHNVTEGHYLSPEDFKCSYKGSCFLMCCSCEKMFTEDNFTNHLCRTDFVICAVCGGQGIHLSSCRLSSSSRGKTKSSTKRFNSSLPDQVVKSSSQMPQQCHAEEVSSGSPPCQANIRPVKTGKKASGLSKPKRILKVRIPIKPPAKLENVSGTPPQIQSKRGGAASAPAVESSSNSQEALLRNVNNCEPLGSSTLSNLDKTINAVALGLTDEARAWEQRMEADRRRIQEARQIYTDSDEEIIGADEEDELLHSTSSSEEEMDLNKVAPEDEPVIGEEELNSVCQLQENSEKEEQGALSETVSKGDDTMPPPRARSESQHSEIKDPVDTDDSDSEKLSLVVDENHPTSGDENAVHQSASACSNNDVPVESIPNQDTAADDIAVEDSRVENSLVRDPSMEEICSDEPTIEDVPIDESLGDVPIDGNSFEETPVGDTSIGDMSKGEEATEDVPIPNAGDIATVGGDDTPTPDAEEVAETKLVEGFTLAGEDVPVTELTLEKPLHIMKTQEVLKECVRTLCWSCVYCSHAKKIAVNGKQLALHVLSEHRISPVDGTHNEMPANERFITKLKEALDFLHSMHFNTDSYDSTDMANSLPYDRSYECFHCRFYTRLHKELYIHNRKMHQKTILLCIMCKSNFYSYSELLCHLCPGIYIPQCNVNFRCCMCNVDELPSAFRLMVHLRKRHHACDVCLETTDDQQKLSNHVWKHKLHHLCYRCGIAYRNKPDITKHLFWKHGTESVLCKKCLQKKWPHVYHFCIPPAIFVCEECTATFSHAVSLRVHKRLHSEDFRYQCADCDEKFISKKLLAKHRLKHDLPVPSVSSNVPEEVKVNTTPPLERKHSPSPPPKEEERSTAPEENITVRVGSNFEKKHMKKKRHKQDEQEVQEEEKQKKAVDVFDLPPLNLSSDSDSSDEEPKKETLANIPSASTEEQKAHQIPSPAGEDRMEVEEPAPIIDGIWDKFQNFQASLEKRENADDPESFMRKTVLMDHDYCLPADRPPGTVASCGEIQQPELPAVPAGSESAAVDGTQTPKSSPVKRKKTPKKRERQSSSRMSSSSSSDSSSDSDSSSCSCGSNCSCSSSSSSSSGSSSSSSDSDDSSSSEGRRKAAARKERRKEKSEKEEENVVSVPEPVITTSQPVAEEPHIDVLEAEPTVRESDLDTTETDTDEDFYDDNPQKLANELLQEKRNLMLLAAVAPINNGGISPTQSQSSQPSSVLPSESTSKRKGKKRRKKVQNSRQAKHSQVQQLLSSQEAPPSLESHYQSNDEHPNPVDANLVGSSQQYSSLYLPPQTPPTIHSSPGVGPPLSQPSPSAVTKTRKIPLSKRHDISAQNAGSGSETDGRTKRKRMRNRFYGFGSDEDEESGQQTSNKVKKSAVGYQASAEPPAQPVMPPLTIKRNQVQPSSDPYFQTPVPSASWSTNLLPSVKSNSGSDSDVHRGKASSSSDSDSDDDAMQIAESPPPQAQFEAPRTGENKDNLYCYCQCPYDEVSEMIACDGEDCRIEWFHFECVGIMVPPKGQWYCPDCRRRMTGGQDYMLN